MWTSFKYCCLACDVNNNKCPYKQIWDLHVTMILNAMTRQGNCLLSHCFRFQLNLQLLGFCNKAFHNHYTVYKNKCSMSVDFHHHHNNVFLIIFFKLREFQDKYAECMEMLHEAQEELKNLRNKTLPLNTSRRFHSLGLFPMVSEGSRGWGRDNREAEGEVVFFGKRGFIIVPQAPAT